MKKLIQVTAILFLMVGLGCFNAENMYVVSDFPGEAIAEVVELANFEDAQVLWHESLFGGSSKTLVVLLFNGDVVDLSKEEMREVGKRAMRIVRKAVDDEIDYQNSRVEFIKERKTKNGGWSIARKFKYDSEDL